MLGHLVIKLKPSWKIKAIILKILRITWSSIERHISIRSSSEYVILCQKEQEENQLHEVMSPLA